MKRKKEKQKKVLFCVHCLFFFKGIRHRHDAAAVAAVSGPLEAVRDKLRAKKAMSESSTNNCKSVSLNIKSASPNTKKVAVSASPPNVLSGSGSLSTSLSPRRPPPPPPLALSRSSDVSGSSPRGSKVNSLISSHRSKMSPRATESNSPASPRSGELRSCENLFEEALQNTKVGRFSEETDLTRLLKSTLSVKQRAVLEGVVACQEVAKKTSWEAIEAIACKCYAKLFFCSTNGSSDGVLDGAIEQLHMLQFSCQVSKIKKKKIFLPFFSSGQGY